MLTGRIEDDRTIKIKGAWVPVIVAVLGAALAAWTSIAVADSRNAEQDKAIVALNESVVRAVAEIGAIVEREAAHTREIAQLQFESLGDRVKRLEQVAEQLQAERRGATYQLSPKP